MADTLFPTVEKGAKLARLIPDDHLHLFAKDIYCAAIAACLNKDTTALAQTVVDWESTIELLLDPNAEAEILGDDEWADQPV